MNFPTWCWSIPIALNLAVAFDTGEARWFLLAGLCCLFALVDCVIAIVVWRRKAARR